MNEFHNIVSNIEIYNNYPDENFVIEEYLGTQTQEIEAQKKQIEKLNMSIEKLIELICLSCNKPENSDIINSKLADNLAMENTYTTQEEQIAAQKKHIDKLKLYVIKFVRLIQTKCV